jgi:tRNA 2-selenouridine synthase SelU
MLGWRFSTFQCAARPRNFMDMLMPNFINLPAFTEDGDVHVVIETPRGSRAKLAYDPKLETFTLARRRLR